MNPIAFIVPAFCLFFGLEYCVARIRSKREIFNFDSSVTNISIGIAERLLNLFIAASFYGLYQYLYERYAWWNIPNEIWVWILLLLATDLIWYWYHRLGHEINILWGAHIVHHQSEEFNFTVSARITTLQAVVRNTFWCILPVLGFRPEMVIAILVVHGTYSFFTHTQLVGRVSWLEYVFITPSLHSVHHASNEKYLNKNYGDIFVFWDKLFGTFQQEEEKAVHGLTHPLQSKSFLWQHFHYYVELFEACRRAGSPVKSIKILFGRPEDLDQGIRKDMERLLFTATKPPVTSVIRGYVVFQIIISLLFLFVYTLFFDQLNLTEKSVGVALLLLTMVNCGALLEQRSWIFGLEIVRMMLVVFSFAYELNSMGLFFGGVLLLLLVIAWDGAERWYFRWIDRDKNVD